jgi:hypothetical protein
MRTLSISYTERFPVISCENVENIKFSKRND